MNNDHLKRLRSAYLAITAARADMDAVAIELNEVYQSQSGAWRFSQEGSLANDEGSALDQIWEQLEDIMSDFKKLLYLSGNEPDFSMLMRPNVRSAPLPTKLPSEAELRAQPAKPGAKPYPWLSGQLEALAEQGEDD